MTWEEALEEINSGFGGIGPFNAAEEATVQKAWKDAPAHVMDLAQKTAASFRAGTVGKPWAYLAGACQRLQKVSGSVTANPVLELSKAERLAEVLLRSNLVHFDRWSEVKDELFGDRGHLRPWAADEVLVQAWKDRWQAVVAAGRRSHTEALIRADRIAASDTYRKLTRRSAAEAERRILHWRDSDDPEVKEIWQRLESEARKHKQVTQQPTPTPLSLSDGAPTADGSSPSAS